MRNHTIQSPPPWRKWLDGLEKIHSSRDYIFQELFYEHSASMSFDYRKRDFLFRVGRWRGQDQFPLERNQSTKSIVGIGHSDLPFSVPAAIRLLARSNYLRVFATNLRLPFLPYSRFQPLPLGLSNPTQESRLHRIFGDFEQLFRAWDQAATPSSDWALYANFNPSTSIRMRSALQDFSKSHANQIVMGTYAPSRTGRQLYLEEVAAHRLVLCPEGNGADTHRFWETLYLGGIPVVLEKSYGGRIARYLSLPCLLVDSWDDLSDYVLVREKLLRTLNQSWNVGALSGRSWLGSLSSGSIEGVRQVQR